MTQHAMQMADLRRDFEYNLRLLDGRDEALATAEAAAEAAAREASSLRGEAACLTAALQEAETGDRSVPGSQSKCSKGLSASVASCRYLGPPRPGCCSERPGTDMIL